MPDKPIVIASVLKPVDDTRMFWKFAGSLSKLEGCSIHVIGFEGKIIEKNNITLYPLFGFKRFALLKRMIAPWKFFFLLKKIKPKVLIICTHELILPALLIKIFFQTKLIYDIRENYLLNLISTRAFPGALKYFLGYWIRVKEIISAPAFTAFFLAEKIYTHQLPFLKNKYLVIENKCLIRIERKALANQKKEKFLFTGTIAEETGIFECVDLIKKLHDVNPLITLCIAGNSPQDSTFQRLLITIKDCPFITLKGGDRLVPHDELIKEIFTADIGLICYPTKKHIEGKIPTKIYEYIGYQLPYIVQENHTYENPGKFYHASISIPDFTAPDTDVLIELLRNTNFYRTIPGDEIYWSSVEPTLIKYIASIIKE